MKTITILSGKGGVGKSSITASLAVLLAKKQKIVAVDCDVDASNLALVLGVKNFKNQKEISTNEKAFVNEKAKDCKSLVDVCTFSAISWNEKKSLPEINKFLCEGCGACKLLCPQGIELKKVKNATVGEAETDYDFPLVFGQLKMGESGSGKVVHEVKKLAEAKDADIMVLDSAAGIGCPVIASVQGSDYVVAVTEPNPSALSDLKRALQIVQHFKIPYGIIINKYDLNKDFSKKIEEFMQKNKIPLLGKIPYDKKFVEALVNLTPIVVYDKKFVKVFQDILAKVRRTISNY
ncbi:ATP-binding protein [Candidatus Pacearchaeota archaeon]|nr:ATP-binding protein [Candidatus Pacearchaeota archaeon]